MSVDVDVFVVYFVEEDVDNVILIDVVSEDYYFFQFLFIHLSLYDVV